MNAPNLLVLALAGATLGLVSCTGPRPVALDYQGYQKTPNKMSSKVTRAVCKSNPYTAKRSFHGRWGGSGNLGGEPVDEMDELFRRHDLVYHLCRSGKNLAAADQALVEKLEELDPATLDPAGREYRERAIGFMTSPWATIVGKPLSSPFTGTEFPGSYFSSPDEVFTFFQPDNPGMPVADTSMIAVSAADPNQELSQQGDPEVRIRKSRASKTWSAARRRR